MVTTYRSGELLNILLKLEVPLPLAVLREYNELAYLLESSVGNLTSE